MNWIDNNEKPSNSRPPSRVLKSGGSKEVDHWVPGGGGCRAGRGSSQLVGLKIYCHLKDQNWVLFRWPTLKWFQGLTQATCGLGIMFGKQKLSSE